MLKVAPMVLNRFQNRFYSSAGRFADATTAKASATSKAMFTRCVGMASKIATAPMAKAGIRTTMSSLRSEACPSKGEAAISVAQFHKVAFLRDPVVDLVTACGKSVSFSLFVGWSGQPSKPRSQSPVRGTCRRAWLPLGNSPTSQRQACAARTWSRLHPLRACRPVDYG
jgi:hypothetical protein